MHLSNKVENYKLLLDSDVTHRIDGSLTFVFHLYSIFSSSIDETDFLNVWTKLSSKSSRSYAKKFLLRKFRVYDSKI